MTCMNHQPTIITADGDIVVIRQIILLTVDAENIHSSKLYYI